MSDLVVAAASGDRAAAGEYFARNLKVLGVVARRIAGASADADDLLSDAMLAVLAKWAEGTGPTEHVNAYIAQSMRNRLIDGLKSPRSKVARLDDSDEFMAEPQSGFRRADLHRELSLVRHAMSTLPEDQRSVLQATVVEGRKPRELEVELGRPSSAIYSLSRRAKLNLRRAVLRTMLEADAPDECREAAARLPAVIADSPDDVAARDLDAHHRDCRRCRRIWSGFASLAGALGIVSLVLVDGLLSPPPSAHADERRPEESAAEERGRESPAAASSDVAPTSRSTGARAADHPAAHGRVRAADAARARASEPTGASPARSASRPRSLAHLARRATSSTALVKIAAAAALATGVGMLATTGYAFVAQQLWFTPVPTAEFDVGRAAGPEGVTSFLVAFEVKGSAWSMDSLTMDFDAIISRVDPPQGWSCDVASRRAVCTTDQQDARGGEFAVSHPGDEIVDGYRFTAVAVTPVGAEVVGTVEMPSAG